MSEFMLLKSVPGAEHKSRFCNCVGWMLGCVGPALLAGIGVEPGAVCWWQTRRPLHYPLHCPVLLTFRIPSKSPSHLCYMQICKIFPFNLMDIFLKLVMSSAGIPMKQGDDLSLLGAGETYRVAHTFYLNCSAGKIGPDLLVSHVSLLEQVPHLEDVGSSLI